MLKSKPKLYGFLVATLIVCSCQKNETETSEQLTAEAQKTFNYLTKVENYSPDLLKVDYKTKSFIYDNDAALAFGIEKNVPPKIKGNDSAQRNQWMGNSGVLYVNSRNITYYLENNFPNQYSNAFAWAAYHWSRVSPNINFRRTNNRNTARVLVSSYYNASDRAWARAQLPRRDGYTGTWVSINTANALNTTNETTKMTLMIHELGHILGFEHSDQTRGNLIPGTYGPSYHASNNCGSIMKSSVYNCNWRSGSTATGWTRDDRTSIRWAYK
ncbi:conserved protein of unknown function [Tenacibaculum sp. 190524A02b]|uniref:M57 family metalloprotease n=1 Tax=Tenacibaculum vairaonense TaxID=3137860 RepID=UPI0032B10EBE